MSTKIKWSTLYIPCLPYIPEELPNCKVCEEGELSFKHNNIFRNGYIEIVFKCVNCGLTYHFNVFDKKLVDTLLPAFKAADTYRFCDVLEWDLPKFIKDRYVKIVEKPTNIWDLGEVKPRIQLRCFCGSTSFTLLRVAPFKYIYTTKVGGKKIEQERTDIWLLCNECSTLHIFGVHGLAKKVINFETGSLEPWSTLDELRVKVNDNAKFLNFLVKTLEKIKPVKEVVTCPFDGSEMHYFTSKYLISKPVKQVFYKCSECGFTIQKLTLEY